MSKSKCQMNGCTDTAHYPKAGLCKSCYAFAFYWKNKSVTHIMRRIRNLKRADDRMLTLMPAKVTPLKKRRRA